MKKILLTATLFCSTILCLASTFEAATSGSSAQSGSSTPLVISQYIGIFNDGTTDNFHAALAKKPPFNEWDITDIAFVHTYLENGYYVADYENARGGQPISGSDTDSNRISQLLLCATDTNPATNPNNYSQANINMKFLISLGWGNNDFSNGAKNPDQFAASVCKIIQDNDLDGFDIDYEDDSSMTPQSFVAVSKALREHLDALGATMDKTGKKLYLTITPATTSGLDMNAINQYYDFVQIQSYDALNDSGCSPNSFSSVNPSKILIGRDYENGDTMTDTRYGMGNIMTYIANNNFRGIMGWRVNAGNQLNNSPKFSGPTMMYNAVNYQ
ncbi:MAG: glycosyl hydrolase family 18 protein [Fusobacteria bacterium]|nr:glycosyl hydrolase family 18 protein [Fusobacteriota bacterium]